MKHLAAAVLVLAGAGAFACSRSGESSRHPAVRPSGNGLWFANGFASEQDQAESLSSLPPGGFSWVLVPSAKVVSRDGRWTVERQPAPPRPISGPAVSAVIEAGRDATAVFEGRDKDARKSLEEALGLAAAQSARDSRFGRVSGVHFDFPVTAAAAPSAALAIRAIRSRLPAGTFVSMAFSEPMPEAGAEKYADLASAVDGFVAMVFGRQQDRAEPADVDILGKPWWAAYSPNAEGLWKGRDGVEKGILPEGFLKRLSDDPARLRFQHDMDVEERAGFGYDFHVRRSLLLDGRPFGAGDEVVFRQPFLTDLVRRLGRDTTGRPNAAGRIFRFSGASDADRIFTVPALAYVLRGGSLDPALRVSVARSSGTITVAAENVSPMPSALSRTSNWIEVDLGRPGIRDVRNAGFDRYEIFTASGARVSLGRASRVRFFETLIGPNEKIQQASILVRPPVPASCCRYRYHVLSATGEEMAADWQSGAAGK
jgi:hypothetical protein